MQREEWESETDDSLCLCLSQSFHAGCSVWREQKGDKKSKGLGGKEAAGRWCWFVLVSGKRRGEVPMWWKTKDRSGIQMAQEYSEDILLVCTHVLRVNTLIPIRWSSRCCLSNSWSRKNRFNIVVKRDVMEEWRDWQVRRAGLGLFLSLKGLSLCGGGNHKHGWEDLAVPCSGRMLTLKSSSWLRALMRSSSSWMAWGQSVISWRQVLENTRECS